MNDPVHYVAEPYRDEFTGEEHGAGWYYWDETWAARIGPFETRAQADFDCVRYAQELEGKP